MKMINLNLKIIKQTSCIMLTLLVLASCSKQQDITQQQLSEIESSVSAHIGVAPEYRKLNNTGYSAQGLRNPFMPTSLSQELQVLEGRQVLPDFARPQEEMESFAIESLQFIGTIKKDKGERYVVIKNPSSSQIKWLKVGEHVGLNRGRISKITANEIEIQEIVSDGKGGFVEKPRVIALSMMTAGVS